jgi:hypothetical protein
MIELSNPANVAVMSSPRQRFAFKLGMALLVLMLIPVLLIAESWSRWGHPVLLIGLGLLACCSVFGEVRLRRQTHLVPDDAIITLLLVIGGPIPAAVVLLVHDLTARLGLRRLPSRSAGALASYVSYPWAMLAGAAVLHLGHATTLGPGSAPTMVAAGLSWLLINWAVARALPEVLWHGDSLHALGREEFIAALPMHLVLLTAAGICVALAPVLGTVGLLAVIAPSVLISTLALPMIARSRDIRLIDELRATELYVRALSARLRISRRERMIAIAAAKLTSRAESPTASGRGVTVAGLWLPPASDAVDLPEPEAVQAWAVARQTRDRWSPGVEDPAGYARGALIPFTSRLLAVAQEWAALTAGGGAGLSQRHAMLALAAEAATRLDPEIVAAAGEIVITESEFADLESFAPKLDLLPIPRGIRRQLLPWALRSYATT